MVECLGIVNSATFKKKDDLSRVYLVDERAGSKNADHTISMLNHYFKNFVPEWVRHVDLWMDNAMTNKNSFVGSWCMEQVCSGRFKSVTNTWSHKI